MQSPFKFMCLLFVSGPFLNEMLSFSLLDELSQYLGQQYGLWAGQCNPRTGDAHGGEGLSLLCFLKRCACMSSLTAYPQHVYIQYMFMATRRAIPGK